MPIEFRCTSCTALLRTPDSAAGREARCPACNAAVPVPSPHGAPAEAPLPADPSSSYPVARPVRAPGAASSAPSVTLQPLLSQAATTETLPYPSPTQPAPPTREPVDTRPAAVEPQPFTIAAVLAAGTQRFAACWGLSLGVGLAALLTWAACQVLVLLVAAPLLALARAAADPPLEGLARLLFAATVAGMIGLSVMLVAWLWAGLRRFGIRTARGETFAFGDLFRDAPLGSMVVILVALTLPCGLLFPLIAAQSLPGPVRGAAFAIAFAADVLVASLIGQSVSHVVDRRQGAWRALAWSIRVCRGRWRQMAGLYGLLCLAYAVSTLISGGLALLAVVPWAEVVVGEAYVRLSDDEAATPNLASACAEGSG